MLLIRSFVRSIAKLNWTWPSVTGSEESRIKRKRAFRQWDLASATMVLREFDLRASIKVQRASDRQLVVLIYFRSHFSLFRWRFPPLGCSFDCTAPMPNTQHTTTTDRQASEVYALVRMPSRRSHTFCRAHSPHLGLWSYSIFPLLGLSRPMASQMATTGLWPETKC